ncbi:MAG: hypothetical protein NTZ27_12095 [Ignavibacteriales bacterium]|nr:hypothetical protein [Ignavibacteriales bacterium]
MKRKLRTMIYASMIFGITLFNIVGCKSDDNVTAPKLEVPVLTTVAVTGVTPNSAVSGGNITSDGGSAIIARGVCWSTNEPPTISDSKTSDGSGTGNFVSSVTGLTENTTYYVRAYATNSDGTGYGAAISFIPKQTYFGQTLPGETPVLFASQVLNSLSVWVEATALSPDGTLFFAAVGMADYSGAKLYYSKYVNNVWTPFVEAPFITDFTYSNEPVFSADGTTLMFTGKKGTEKLDLWSVSYTNNSWGVPVALPSTINSNANEFRGSYMTNGTFYFGSNRSGMMQVYKSTSTTAAAELLSAPINMRSYEGDPCIALDGHFLIFYSGRSGVSSDLYVSFINADGEWGTPKNLGANFNSASDEYGAHLSSDGNYLFFTRHTPQGNSIYWVAISAIEKLR